MTNIITNNNQQQGNFMFDTTRFIDVTSQRQRNNGTLMFLDSHNPGVYYGSYSSGYVRRIIATQNTRSDLDTGSRTSFNNETIYQINRRCHFTAGNGITSVLLPKTNDRLSRIQEMANKFNRDSVITSYVTGSDQNTFTMITPRIR